MITRHITRVLRTTGLLHVMVLIFILGFIAGAPPWAHAQIPRYINYQGKLTDSDDNPITGDISITMRLYDASTGGTALWTETQSATVTRGIFSILLGSTTVLDSLDFDDAYWYSVEVESDGEMTPRQRLTAVAYAINADKLDGYDASQFLRSDADTTLTGDLTVTSGVITAGANEDVTLDPTGTGNIVMAIDSTSGDFKVTDGTTNFLHVDNDTGNVTIANNLTVGSAGAFSTITVTGASDLRGDIYDSVGTLTIADALSQTGSSNQVTFAGNVDADNGLDVTGNLTVSGTSTLAGALDLNSNLDLDYSGTSPALSVTQASTGVAAQFTGGEVVIGNDTANANALSAGELYVQGDLEVDGTIYGTVSTSGATTLGDSTLTSLVVTGTSDLQGNVSDSIGTFTIADDIDITPTALTSGGTNDYALNISQTLNDTAAAGGSDVYRGIKLNLTETDTTGWDNVYLIDLQVGETSKFNIDDSGNITASGALDMGSSKITSLATPTASTDAATKGYVDAITPATAGGWTDAGTGVYLLTSTDNVGVGTTSTDTYKLNVSGSTNTTSLYIGGTEVTSTASELNILDGVTANATELNILDGVTASTSELNILDGVTATATELNLIDGYTGSTANLNTLTNASNADALHVHAAAGISTNIVSSVDGVTNDGGDIDLVAGSNITITPSDVANTITIAASDTDTQLSEAQVEGYIFDADNAGTISSGTLALDSLSYTGTLDDTNVNDALTISGGTIDNSIIGGTTPAAATVTGLTMSNTGSATVMTFDDGTATSTVVYDSTQTYPINFSGKITAQDVEIRGSSPAVLSFGSTGNRTSLIYDPDTDEIRFSRGTFAAQFRNLVKNASFESFSAMEEFHAYDPNYATASAYSTQFEWNTGFGYQGGWDKFSPDNWEFVSGKVFQHAPLFFETGFVAADIVTATYKQDFVEGVSAVRLEYDGTNPGKITQTITKLKPSQVYSVGVKMRVEGTRVDGVETTTPNGIARVDILGEDGGNSSSADTSTTLSSNVSSTVLTIPVASVEDFPPFGTIKVTDGVNTERIRYEGLDSSAGANKFLKCTRANTSYAFSSGDDVTVAPFVPLTTSTNTTYTKFEGQFATDPKASAITIVLSAEEGNVPGAGVAYFDTVQIVAGGTVPEYTPNTLVDTGDQTVYGSLRIGRASDEKGGILSVDKFVRTRGLELFTDDPGLSGATGGGMTTMGGSGIFPPGPGWNSSTYTEPATRLQVSGTYSPSAASWRDYKVEIDGANTYKWYYMDDSTAWTYQEKGSGISMPTGSFAFLDGGDGSTTGVSGVKIMFSSTDNEAVGDTWWFNASNTSHYTENLSYEATSTYTPGKTRIYVDPEPSSPYFNQMVFEDGSTKVSLSDLAGTVTTQAYIGPTTTIGGNSCYMWLEVSGTYSGTTTTFEIKIDENYTLPSTTADKFRWKTTDGAWSSLISINGTWQALGATGISIKFYENQWTGYYNAALMGDAWMFTAYGSATGADSTKVSTLNGKSGPVTLSGVGNISVTPEPETNIINISYTGTGATTATIDLTPEFPTAVLSGSGNGIMTADFDSTQYNYHNYYNWTGNLDNQSYDIYVRVLIPEDFSSWDSTAAITYNTNVDASTNGGVQLTVFDVTDTSDYVGAKIATSGWTANTVTGTLLNTTYNNGDGDYMTLKFTLTADNATNTKLGEVKLKYNKE